MYIHWYKNKKSDFYFFFYKIMQELETLLKSLVHRGRKPCGEEIFDLNIENGVISMFPEDFFADNIKLNLRSIVSLESGLWQFVCRNKLYKKQENFREDVYKTQLNTWWFSHNYQYRLLESALIPEEELGKFLIDNIKVEWNQISTPETK